VVELRIDRTIARFSDAGIHGRPHAAAQPDPRVLADHGHDRPEGCWSGPGRQWLASLPLPAVSREVIEDDLALIDALQQPIDRLDWELRRRAQSEPDVEILTQLPGVGPFTALVLLAESSSAYSPGRRKETLGVFRLPRRSTWSTMLGAWLYSRPPRRGSIG